jgi:predicted enzyme related to lactoylglutathione lyase
MYPRTEAEARRGLAMTQHADLNDATEGQLLIPVVDLERAVAIYRDTLELRFRYTAPPQMSFFQAGDVRLLVGVPESGRAAHRGSIVYFKVDDIDAVHGTLVDRGVEFSGAPHRVHKTPQSELWLAEFQDIDGNPLALMSEVAVAS